MPSLSFPWELSPSGCQELCSQLERWRGGEKRGREGQEAEGASEMEREKGRQAGRGNRSACLGANSPPIAVGAAGRGGRATALHLPQHQDVLLLLLHLNGCHFIILLSLGRGVVDGAQRGEKIKQTRKQNQTNPNPKTRAKRKWHFLKLLSTMISLKILKK